MQIHSGNPSKGITPRPADYRVAAHAVLALALIVLGCSRGDESPPIADAPVKTADEPATPPVTATPAFFDAALNGHADPVVEALQAGVSPDSRDEENRTALMLAAFNGHRSVAEVLLNSGAGVDKRDSMGRTALMYASTGTDAALVRLLLSRQAQVNVVDGGEKWTALMFAAAEGHEPVVRALLENGADVTLTDNDGDTALSFARKSGHTPVAKLLEAALKQVP